MPVRQLPLRHGIALPFTNATAGQTEAYAKLFSINAAPNDG